MNPDDFIGGLLPGALSAEKRSGVPAAVLIAQAALESQWGASVLAREARNLFRIKSDRWWCGESVELPSRTIIDGAWATVIAEWRVYPSYEWSLMEHALSIRKDIKYARAFQFSDAERFVLALQDCGYSSYPQYYERLIGTLKSHRFTNNL